MSTETIYPLATTDGESIPLDVIAPIQLWKFILETNQNTGLKSLPSLNCLLAIKASQECILRFGSTVAAIPTNGNNLPDSVIIPPITMLIVKPTNIQFSLIALGATTVWVQVMQKWAALSQTILFERR
jgi:hypothetical protein